MIQYLNNIDDDIVLYHYSLVKFDKICPPSRIPGFDGEDISKTGFNKDGISLLPSPMPIEKLKELKDNGFVRYDKYEDLYLYEIRLSDIIEKMLFFKYESKREPAIEIIKKWHSEKNKIMSIGKNITSVEFELAKNALKAKYYHKYGLIYASDIEDDFVKMINNANEEFLEDIDYNIKNGSKRQYASYIPHFNVVVRDCIPISKVSKIIEA